MTGSSSISTSPTMLITGASSGIGLGLARAVLGTSGRVYAMQRRSSPLLGTPGYVEMRHDLRDLDRAPSRLAQLLLGVPRLDRVVLNAGVSAELRDLANTPLSEIERVMKLNAWANKVLIDALLSLGIPIVQIIGISSGAAVNANRGWNAYALSKATFAMLIKLYAAERPDIHFCSFAPGLVHTKMQDDLANVSERTLNQFPSVRRLIAARGTEDMPEPDAVAGRLLAAFDRVLSRPSGGFVDIREMEKKK